MLVEVIIFGAVSGIVVILGRKLPLTMQLRESTTSTPTITSVATIQLSEEKENNPGVSKMNIFGKNLFDKKKTDSTEDFSVNLNEDFWEPTFFSDQDLDNLDSQKPLQEGDKKKKTTDLKSEGLKKESIAFPPVKKEIGTNKDAVKATSKVEKPVKKEEKIEEESGEKEVEEPRRERFFPKIPLGMGMPKRVTLNDLISQASDSFKAGNYGKAEEFYIKAAAQDPNNPKIFTRLGYIYLMRRNFSDARDSLKHAIELDDTIPSRHFNLAIAYLNLDQKEEALNHIKKAISQEPDNDKYQAALESLIR